jgi:receptor protein-tyrosine kinase
MTDNFERLNLIQRAAKRLATQPVAEQKKPQAGIQQAGIQQAAAQQAPRRKQAEEQPPDLRGERPAVASSGTAARVRPAPPPPVPEGAVSHPVHLNLSRLRHAQIATPDNVSSTTYNEFRAIKRRLLPMARGAAGNTLVNNLFMVTSALPGEGKTFTAMNLAISLAAERNLHVVLVDGDVVRSSLDGYFEGANTRGLTDLLNGRCENISDVMHRCVEVPNLRVIFAGKHDAGSPELLASRRMADICQDLSSRYSDRIVIIDAPPVLAAAEPTALAMHIHHLIMVVAAQQPSRHHVEEALSRVASCRSIMMLFNKSPHWRHTPASSYYYYYRKDTDGAAA